MFINYSSKAISSCTDSEYYELSAGTAWKITNLQAGNQASIEFKTKDDPASLFPIGINLQTNCLSNIEPVKAYLVDNKEEVMFAYKNCVVSSDLYITYE